MGEPDDVNKKVKKNIIVADQTSSCKLILWEIHTQSLELGKSSPLIYFFEKYNTKKYLSFPKNNFTITELRTQQFERPHESDDFVSIKEAQTVGVLMLDSYNSCLNCKARVEQ